MTQINVQLGSKTVTMNLLGQNDVTHLRNVSAEMIDNGWLPVVFFAQRPNGSRAHLVYQSARTGLYRSMQSIR
jgi:hypothetical protein